METTKEEPVVVKKSEALNDSEFLATMASRGTQKKKTRNRKVNTPEIGAKERRPATWWPSSMLTNYNRHRNPCRCSRRKGFSGTWRGACSATSPLFKKGGFLGASRLPLAVALLCRMSRGLQS